MNNLLKKFTYSLLERLYGGIFVSDMTKRFSDGARRIISNALLFAKDMGHSYIGSEHLLLGILKEDCVSARLLCERGAEAAVIKKKIIGIVGSGCKTTLSTDDMTPICRRIILRASIIASGERADGVDAEHLLSAMLREECVAVRLLRECSVDTDELKELLDELFAVDFEVFAEAVKARIKVSELHVDPAQKHHRVLWIFCHFHSISVSDNVPSRNFS